MPSALNVLRPALWPVAHLATMTLTKKDARPEKAPQASPIAKPWEHVLIQLSTIPKLVLAALMWATVPEMEVAKTLAVPWILKIVLRDVGLFILLPVLWDFVLYGPLFKEKMSNFKFNPKYPKMSQFRHDLFWTTSATLLSSVQEVAMVHLCATGRLPYSLNMWSVATLLWVLSMPYWRIVHFYVLHRGMHPWRIKSIPDVGKYLYLYVHSLHHKSKNPTALSGISMHPVESIGYFSAALIPTYFGAHPIAHLLAKADLANAAQIGHDGHADPGTASYAHWLHHHFFECNYGESYVPLDYWFGTFRASEKKAE